MMTNNDTKKDLIDAGHDPKLVERTEATATQLRALLDDIPTPPQDDLKSVFEEQA